MKIVVDSNRVIAALIKDSTTRMIIFDKSFEFFAPEFIKSEIEKYRDEIMQKADIGIEEFDIMLSIIFENITIVSKEEYCNYFAELKEEIKDLNDLSYFELCLTIKAEGIWTHDPHFLEQRKCKIFTNIDMLRFRMDKKD